MAFCLITGATDGIGFQTAKELAKRDKDLIIHGRDVEKLKRAQDKLFSLNRNITIETLVADFSYLKETAGAFHKIDEQIDVLINNAGLFDTKGIITADGFGLTYQVNHLAHFLITHILLDNLKKNAPSKIIVVSSMAHASSVDFEKLKRGEFLYSYAGYSCSKLCNILFAFRMAEMLKDFGVSVNCLHPGVINTKLLVENWSACGIDVSESHRMLIYAYELPFEITGEYLKDFSISRAADFAYDKTNQQICYDISLRQIADYLNLTNAKP